MDPHNRAPLPSRLAMFILDVWGQSPHGDKPHTRPGRRSHGCGLPARGTSTAWASSVPPDPIPAPLPSCVTPPAQAVGSETGQSSRSSGIGSCLLWACPPHPAPQLEDEEEEEEVTQSRIPDSAGPESPFCLARGTAVGFIPAFPMSLSMN